jgi:hypothetical protein
MSTAPYCPFCYSTKYTVTSECAKYTVQCCECHGRGPDAETPELALCHWGRRPLERSLKQSLSWACSVHAANASEYEAKSVSKSRRDRQIGILQKIADYLLKGHAITGIHRGTPDEQMIAAGMRAKGEAERLRKIAEEA